MKYFITSWKNNKEKKEIEKKRLYCYDLRCDDDGFSIATIEKNVLVNRVGSIITDKKLNFNSKYFKKFIDFEKFSDVNKEVDSIEQLLKIKRKENKTKER